MIRKLKLENYRSFESYTLEDLARVNLLVGSNNCGKTSILEAVNFLAAQGDPRVLIQSTHERGEFLLASGQDRTEDYRRPDPHDLSHQFFGHRIDVGSRFLISSDDELGSIAVSIKQADETESDTLFGPETGSAETPLPPIPPPPTPPPTTPPPFGIGTGLGQTLVLRISGRDLGKVELALNDDGSFSWNRRALQKAATARSGARPVRFLTVDSLDPGSMASLWDNVVVEGREPDVEEAMRILEPRLNSIRFLTADRIRKSPGIMFGFEGARRRVPLGSQGDGTRRLLALSIPLTELADGLLLVDEIDTGLHWNIMEKMWALVVETARRSSNQVFATTHSYDCVMGLASLLVSQPELAEEVSIQKIERSLPRAVAFDADNIRVAAEQSIELR